MERHVKLANTVPKCETDLKELDLYSHMRFARQVLSCYRLWTSTTKCSELLLYGKWRS